MNHAIPGMFNDLKADTREIDQKLRDKLASLREARERHDELLRAHQRMRLQARRIHEEVIRRVAEHQKLTAMLQNSHRTAFNLMEDTIRAKAALTETKKRFRSLVSSITDAPWTADTEGQFVMPQSARERILHAPRRQDGVGERADSC